VRQNESIPGMLMLGPSFFSPDIQNRRPPFEYLQTSIVVNTVDRQCSLAIAEDDVALAVMCLRVGVTCARLVGNCRFPPACHVISLDGTA